MSKRKIGWAFDKVGEMVTQETKDKVKAEMDRHLELCVANDWFRSLSRIDKLTYVKLFDMQFDKLSAKDVLDIYQWEIGHE